MILAVALLLLTGAQWNFSSAVLNAIDLRKAGAILVGEATGGKPNS